MSTDQNHSSDEPTERPKGGLKRRDLLKAIGAVPAATLLPLAPSSAAPASQKTQAPAASARTRKVLNEHEWQTVRVLSDWIIPADERSGSATQAGVPEFIDDWLEFKAGRLLAQIRGGLTWLDLECNRLFGRDFVECSAAQQKQLLDRIAYPKTAALEDSNAVAFFNAMRDLVVAGFFTSKMGVEDLPYLGNKMLTDWQGCPPEVLAKLGLKGDGT